MSRKDIEAVRLNYSLPQCDVFIRDHPAIDEGPQRAWEAARRVIDFAGALLRSPTQASGTSRIREAVMLALLRRATVTTEAIWWLMSRGLEEPAIATLRTLLDIELNMKLVTQNATDTMAKRLAAYHYYGYQLHGQKMLRDRPTRQALHNSEDGTQRTIDAAGSYARFLESDVFDDVRDEVRASQYWHGFKNVAEAFAAVRGESDYRTMYDTSTFYVHDTNVDADFADIVENTIQVKPVVQRDPAATYTQVANATLRLYSVIRMYADARGLTDEPAEESNDGLSQPEDVIHLNSVHGLAAFVMEHFGGLTDEEDMRVVETLPEANR